MGKTTIILTVRGQWAETQYLRRNGAKTGTLYRRSINGGWGGGYDRKDFAPHCEPTTEEELEADMLTYGLEDAYDAGEVGLVVEVGR